MKRALVLAPTVLAALAVALPASAATPTYNGTVGPGFTIKLTKKPTKAGKIKLVVADKASIHNFQIEGPGLDRAVTTVGFTGTKTVRIHLRRGTYKYYCQPHESSMHGTFKVT